MKVRKAVMKYRYLTSECMNRLKEEVLRSSIKECVEKGDFHLCYQPIVDISTNEITTFEVLLRWQFNDEFIPFRIYRYCRAIWKN
ncbi:EAL domain-containing protein [Pseudoalteromonas sp. B193]